MSADSIYVNYSGCTDVADVLNASTRAVTQVIDHIQNAVQQLQASWEGSSMDAYGQVQTRWNSDMADMQAMVAQYAPTLDEMSGNYSQTDNNLALQWSGIG